MRISVNAFIQVCADLFIQPVTAHGQTNRYLIRQLGVSDIELADQQALMGHLDAKCC